MSRRLLLALAASGLSLHAASPARADSHHQIVSQTPIKQNNKTIGFRATLIVDPENRTGAHATLGGDVRIGLGSLKYTGDRKDSAHRESMAGVQPGYILHQFKIREVTGPNSSDRGPATETLHTGGQMKEVEIEVLYADNPALKPGMKADLVAAFWKNSYWHPWGSADGPMHSSQDFVIELPHDNPPSAAPATAAAPAAPAPQAAPVAPVAPHAPTAPAAIPPVAAPMAHVAPTVQWILNQSAQAARVAPAATAPAAAAAPVAAVTPAVP